MIKMETRVEFQKMINSIISDFGEDVLSYNQDEFWMVQSIYEYIEYYAVMNRMKNTAIALVLARGLHNGSYRKLTIKRNGQTYRLPYLIHPLSVCRMLIDLHAPLSHDELDILYATALCHDMIEDLDFRDGGKELYTDYHLDPRVYENVTYLSKRYDFTSEQEEKFFHNIETHRIALLVKLSDRGNNVEDLYNMKVSKVYEYTGETDHFFIPMCDYGIAHYPSLSSSFQILRDKIISLTEAARILVIRYELEENILINKIKNLQEENDDLRNEWKSLWRVEE